MKTFSRTHDYLVSLLKVHFSAKKEITIIDYGCGSGALLPHLFDFKIKNYYGLDINAYSIVQAKRQYLHNKNYSFRLIKPDSLPSWGKTNNADVIILVGVWQYLSSKEQKYVAQEAQRVLKKGGLLLLSCSVDHLIYRWLNIYRFFVPHHYVDRQLCVTILKKAELKIVHEQERGFILNPLFSDVIVFFFDVIDQIVFKSRGTLGPAGQWARRVAHPFLALEYKLPIDHGYTLYVAAQK